MFWNKTTILKITPSNYSLNLILLKSICILSIPKRHIFKPSFLCDILVLLQDFKHIDKMGCFERNLTQLDFLIETLLISKMLIKMK